MRCDVARGLEKMETLAEHGRCGIIQSNTALHMVDIHGVKIEVDLTGIGAERFLSVTVKRISGLIALEVGCVVGLIHQWKKA